MRCRECESLVWDYLDGLLPDAQRRQVADHLATCPQCTGLYQQMRSFPVPTDNHRAAPPPDFTAKLMERIAPLPTPNELAARQVRASQPFRGPFGATIAFAAAAAAILLGLVSTSAMAIFSGRTVATGQPGSNGDSFALSLRIWMFDQVLPLVTWPIAGVVAAMLLTLTFLWVRVVAPQRH